MDYESKKKWITLISDSWLLILSVGTVKKNKRRSETETGESHAVFGDDSREIKDHSREERKEPSKLPKRKDS